MSPARIVSPSYIAMIDVSDNTQRRIEALFPRDDWQRVSDYLRCECGTNLPLLDDSYGELVERIRFAVLRLSNGEFKQLETATKHAAADWRDTLVAAGFASDVEAHLVWRPGNKGCCESP